MADNETLRFYADQAQAYVTNRGDERILSAALTAFLDQLPVGAKVLELGTGSGREAAHMLSRGFDVTPTDASAELAELAQQRLGRPVVIMRFDQLEAEHAYDGVWANASLLHAPRGELTDDLRRIRRSLKVGGLFIASFKAGQGEGRDRFGRYYNYPDEAGLAAHMQDAGPWSGVSYSHFTGSGYDGAETDWIRVTAVR